MENNVALCHECGAVMVRDVRPCTFQYKAETEIVDLPGWYCTKCDESQHDGADTVVSDAALRRAKARLGEA